MKTLKEVESFLLKIPSIHSGGCAIASLAMYLWLKANNKLCKTTTIVYQFRREDSSFDNNSEALAGRLYLADSCTHSYLKHRGRDYNDPSDYSIELNVTEEVVVESLLKIDAWNSWFNRERYIPVIEKKLKINLNI